MARLSRGCLRCRQRGVRCDEGRPSCRRCINRSEVCEGYRDEASLIFRYETDKVIEHARASQAQAHSPASSKASSQASRKRSNSFSSPAKNLDPSRLAPGENSGLKLKNPHPWLLKELPSERAPPVEEQAVDSFMEKYVIYPCNQTSSPGFLEHLPSMFKEVNVTGRYALRWAVRAASYADLSKDQNNDILVMKALQCYGMALSALGESLAEPGKVPDDYDLMTVVILDIFETLYTPNEAAKGSHAQGMAQILRLRGSDLVYNSRGWSLFRLAHHRIQQQQLAFDMRPNSDTTSWLNQLNENEPYVRLEKNADSINDTCKRARTLLTLINAGGLLASTIVEMIQELHILDQSAVSWRQTSEWSFKNLAVSERSDLEPAANGITDTIQLHSDIWMAYEWDYHRAARITFLEQLLKCSKAALDTPDLDVVEEKTLTDTITECTSTIQWLADEILSTVPQSFGDVDHMGRLYDTKNGPPRCRGIGGYLLLWPIKTVKAQLSATTLEQKERGGRVFERIRDYTGMKSTLGDMSII
ncbi:uncharacterized protein LY89DRAFT_470567 [Mollisia scopiformis]|uniref:Zn(2)-C6 fungal-type domain-containing protein n=1 Tax=Mollisia scopiformis TaxID=149040 RepID=A0A194XIZ2_MOLSC|nr:uncharacterized protein LY89DRAFT_470567 [Mollisia scopiformis]KUJ20089.1 hypothetical protein LY89DRAFT_470567 [Mollisia scopiformis]